MLWKYHHWPLLGRKICTPNLTGCIVTCTKLFCTLETCNPIGTLHSTAVVQRLAMAKQERLPHHVKSTQTTLIEAFQSNKTKFLSNDNVGILEDMFYGGQGQANINPISLLKAWQLFSWYCLCKLFYFCLVCMFVFE